MNIVILRFDAPLMSFGGVMVDQHGVIDRYPGQSFLSGLFGNAFGYRHGDSDLLNKLQSRIEYAARWDVNPEKIVDYHTVDLGQEKMKEGGWTTRGFPEHRSGGPEAKLGTHQRYRHYWANGIMTVAATLLGDDEPSVSALAQALTEPARPLFLGRKTCLPSTPLLVEMVTKDDVLSALRNVPPVSHNGRAGAKQMEACWPERLKAISAQHRQVRVYDQRDWKNQLHSGSRVRIEGTIEVIGS